MAPKHPDEELLKDNHKLVNTLPDKPAAKAIAPERHIPQVSRLPDEDTPKIGCLVDCFKIQLLFNNCY